MEEHEPIIFEGKTLFIQEETYAMTNHIKLTLMWFDDKLGGLVPFMVATADVEHVELAEDEVLIKDYSENKGIMPALIKAGIIAKPHDKVASGFIFLHICQLIN